MKECEFFEKLGELDMQAAYDHWEEGNVPEMPYVLYRFRGSNNFVADGKVYLEINQIDLELYTENKDIYSEEKVKRWIDSIGIPFEKTEDYIETERMYRILYEMEA